MVDRVLLSPAFVLHARPYRNSSLIVDLLTRQYGRVALVARSARGHRSRFKGQLQPFVPLLVSYSGRSELKNLSHLELSSRPYALAGNRILCGFYVNELLMRLLLKGESSPGIFHAYEQVLQQLDGDADLELSLRRFECALLAELGYGLNCEAVWQTAEPIVADGYYRYLDHQGFVAVDAVAQDDAIFPGAALLAFAHGESLTAAQRQHIKRLLRHVLSLYLDGKPIKSRDMMEKIVCSSEL